MNKTVLSSIGSITRNMRLKGLALVILCTFSFSSCKNKASEEELVKIRKFRNSAYSDIVAWRVPMDSLKQDYSDLSKALDVPIAKFQRVHDMIEELPDNQQEEFKGVKKTLDSLKDLDERYSNPQ